MKGTILLVIVPIGVAQIEQNVDVFVLNKHLLIKRWHDWGYLVDSVIQIHQDCHQMDAC